LFSCFVLPLLVNTDGYIKHLVSESCHLGLYSSWSLLRPRCAGALSY